MAALTTTPDPVVVETDSLAAKKAKSSWNSLERAKLKVDIAKALATLLLTATLAWLGQDFTSTSQRTARLTEQYAQVVKKRTQLWDTIGADLYYMYCYNLQIEDWQKFTPQQISDKKRHADQYMFANRPFFTRSFYDKYQDFMGASFDKDREMPQITEPNTAKQPGLPPANQKQRLIIHERYYALLQELQKELGIVENEQIQVPLLP